MESSPKSIAIRRSRISLSRRPQISDSPKTPGRLITSLDTFHTSPSVSSGNIQQSTPLNRYKRTCFVEESPSQDYDISPRPLTMSQDVRSNVVDVEWKWDEQCPIAKRVTEAKSRPFEPNRIIRRSKKAILRESPECVQKKGFHKFKEEFLRNVISDVNRTPSAFEGFDNGELDSSFKENNNLLEINSIAIMKEAKSIYNETGTSELIEMPKPNLETNLFDDLDLPDQLLVHCSQQVEETYHNQIKRKKIDNDAAFDQLDSFDELLSSIPMGESCVKSAAGNEKQRTSSKYYPPDHSLQCRSPLIRHNSMPTNAHANKYISNEPPISLSCNKRMLLNDNGTEVNSGFSSCSSPATSETEKRRCTAEEINQKRLEAMQRRQASRLKEPGNTNAIQKSLDIEKQQLPLEYSSSPPQRRTSFIRHNSMPTNANINVSNVAIISLNRSNSMPINDKKTKLNSRLPSSISEFAETGKRQCTADEINRKRLEAIQRREARKQNISSTTTRIISLNMKYNAS